MNKLTHQLDTYLRRTPKLGRGVYIARGAVVIGAVTLGEQASVWYNAVLRGDINRIVVGHHSNIQDNAVLHLADDFPCIVGNYVTIGHSAIVHASLIPDSREMETKNPADLCPPGTNGSSNIKLDAVIKVLFTRRAV